MTTITPAVRKKHRLTDMVYDEVSFVDAGANQDAHVVLVKRDLSKIMMPGDAGQIGGKPGASKPKSSGRKADWYDPNRAPANADGSKRKGESKRAKDWREDRHPRNAKGTGSPRGGTFKSTSASSKKKYGKGGTTKAKQQNSGKRGGGTYTVKKGDTLWDIAQRVYGDPYKWKLIAKANGIKDPRKLPIGITLKLPVIGGSKKKAAKAKPKEKTITVSDHQGSRLVMNPGGKISRERGKTVRRKVRVATPVKASRKFKKSPSPHKPSSPQKPTYHNAVKKSFTIAAQYVS